MDQDGSGTVGTDELRKVIRSMQESAGPFHKELKEEGARVAGVRKRANELLEARL